MLSTAPPTLATRERNLIIVVVSKLNVTVLFPVLVLGLGACQPDPVTAYREFEREQAFSGQRSDSLFAGLYFGMSHDSFRTFSLEQHQAGRFAAGGLGSSSWVSYRVDSLLSKPVEFNFYPTFEAGRIVALDADLYYVATTSRDASFSQDVLLQEVLELMDNWYGEGYFQVPAPRARMPDLYVKVNHNRRLVIQKHRDGYMIQLRYTDLSTEQSTR